MDGTRLLAHRVTFDGRPITAADATEVGFFDLPAGTWHSIGISKAFNWQQGALLQWLGPHPRSLVIYNDRIEDKFVARIVQIDQANRRDLPQAIYSVHPSGKYALTVRFERHYFCRAYHYEGIADQRWNVPIHDEDGIIKVDLESGAATLIVRTVDIAKLHPPQTPPGTKHWLEHILWNPSGSRFAFLHRFGTDSEFHTRVCTSDANGTNIQIVIDTADAEYSHMAWRDEVTFVVFRKRVRPVGKIYSQMSRSKRPLLSAIIGAYHKLRRKAPLLSLTRSAVETGYALFEDGKSSFSWLAPSLLTTDGHPGWSRDGRFMITDTYNDTAGFRHLLLFDSVQNKTHWLGSFYSPYNDSSFRCDLHPRFGSSERYVVIDSAHSGRRQIMVLEIDWNHFQR